MFSLRKKPQTNHSLGNQPLILNVTQLREDERIEFKYDRNNNLIAIQKIKLSLLEEPMEAVAETDIEANGSGRVFYQGSSWKALSEGEKIFAGEKLLVTAKHHLTLLVIPAAP